MILKSIILNGFKSFGKKTVLDISKNVTAIVGPNGSGKSNIVEAIRFVLGEQSMKNIRTKSLSDLIHNGESSLSRASVSLVIDNKEKFYNENISPDMSGFLSYDEIVLTREIYKDGSSIYKINNATVRLKDIQELLALAGIGQSIHTIISQGEADKILSSSKEDRKLLISDAIGLKVLENRLKDSSKKLEKANKHIETANLLRREISPELRELKSLVEKLESVKDIKQKLKIEYIKFFIYESENIQNRKNNIADHKDIDIEIQTLQVKLSEIKKIISEHENNLKIKNTNTQQQEDRIREQIILKEKEKSILSYQKNDILNKIKKEVKVIHIDKIDFLNFKNEILDYLTNFDSHINSSENIEVSHLNSILNQIRKILEVSDHWHDEVLNMQELNTQIQDIDKNIIDINIQIQEYNSQIDQIRQKQNNDLVFIKNIYNEDKDLEIKLREKINKRDQILKEMVILREEENQFNFSIRESEIFLNESLGGLEQYKNQDLYKEEMKKYSVFDNKRNIEKFKIKIEEIGILDGNIIKNNYDLLSDRDEHLKREIEDLENTRVKILELIEELKLKIKQDFEIGFEKINILFNEYFKEIFSGGNAKLIPVKIEKSAQKEDIESLTNQSDKEIINQNIGIDIVIDLPSKKIKDINMLSGGEKTLLSISLLFALTTLTPPPFMILDETDAALDESNARKYGKLLQRLAKNSRLLVITHNRETMNKADVLYGITIGGDGSSRILSIKFEESIL